MRALGVLLVIVGAGGLAWGTTTADRAPRPRDLAGALAAPAGVALALLGALLVAVPDFLG